MYKQCRVCGNIKDIKSCATTCTSCVSSGIKACTICGEIKSLEEFAKSSLGRHSSCRVCYNRYSRQRKKERYDTDQVYRANELLKSTNRRLVENDLTALHWLDTVEQFNNTCAYCGNTHNLTMDHVIPVSLGGTTTKTNVIPACLSCNVRKSNKELVEWYTAQDFYQESRLKAIQKFIKGGV